MAKRTLIVLLSTTFAALGHQLAKAQQTLEQCRFNWSTSGAANNPVVSCQSGYTDDNGVASGGSCRMVPSEGTTAIACASGFADSNGVDAGGSCVSLASGTGGDNTSTVTDNDIQYRVHTFTSAGNFTPVGSMMVDVLVVGGGGAGGTGAGGGGGGGGVLYTTGYALSGAIVAVSVGAGGVATISTATAGASGGNSSFGNLTALGGGGGGSSGATAGGAGGNGGGAAGGDAGGRGTGTVGQGNSGGGGSGTGVESYHAGGGGGGSGVPGSNATQTSPAIAGAGGAGIASAISGIMTYYGGGGGGGAAATAAAAGVGGAGGGGAGSRGAVNATNAAANTGGGGGGSGYSGTTNAMPGHGGSGIVMIRYPITGCSTNYTDSNGSTVSGGSCVSSLVTIGTGNACDLGYTDSNGTTPGGTCIANTVTTGNGTACDNGYTDSNGPTSGGGCVINTVTTGAGTNCDAGYFDTNGNTIGGTCAAVLGSCNAILSNNPTAPTGVYRIDPDGASTGNAAFSAYCDMTTDSGGWTLVLNYLHQGGTNPNLNVLSNRLPLMGSNSLGGDESADTGVDGTWGHTAPSLLTQISYTNFRFYCRSGAHSRIMHFKTSAACKSYFNTGTGSCTGITTFTALGGHNASLPGSASAFFSNQGSSAMTEFTFYAAGSSHWGIRGLGNRWECDDFPNNSANHTQHQIFVK